MGGMNSVDADYLGKPGCRIGGGGGGIRREYCLSQLVRRQALSPYRQLGKAERSLSLTLSGGLLNGTV